MPNELGSIWTYFFSNFLCALTLYFQGHDPVDERAQLRSDHDRVDMRNGSISIEQGVSDLADETVGPKIRKFFLLIGNCLYTCFSTGMLHVLYY